MAVNMLGVWAAVILASVTSTLSQTQNLPCGGQANLQEGESISIQSPGFPRPYRAGFYCLWTANAPANTNLRLTCKSFSVMSSPGCRGDVFWVIPNKIFDKKDSQYYCGTGIIDTTINGNSVAAVFFSQYKNYVNPYPGFTCTLKVISKEVTTIPPSSNFQCGVKGTSRIVGGRDAAKNEWPWQAGIRLTSNGNLFCGAALIDKQWLVTAAHCVDRYHINNVFVSLGGHERRLDRPTDFSKDITIAEKIVHENYDKQNVDNDIALIRLSEPIVYSAGIKPICLPCQFTSTNLNGKIGTVTGWGTTAYGGDLSDVLQEVNLPIKTTSECQKYLGTAVTDNMICTLKTGQDACAGDSGGPLSWSTGGRYYLVGLVSWGRGCAKENQPGVYAKVTSYLSWIKEKTSIDFCSQRT